mgnify:CR=1 FL=1
MGYKIWRKDKYGWELAFDYVYPTREKVDERIAELNAAYPDKIKYGELSFYPYRDDIVLSKDGNIVDDKLPVKKFQRRDSRKRRSRGR